MEQCPSTCSYLGACSTSRLSNFIAERTSSLGAPAIKDSDLPSSFLSNTRSTSPLNRLSWKTSVWLPTAGTKYRLLWHGIAIASFKLQRFHEAYRSKQLKPQPSFKCRAREWSLLATKRRGDVPTISKCNHVSEPKATTWVATAPKYASVAVSWFDSESGCGELFCAALGDCICGVDAAEASTIVVSEKRVICKAAYCPSAYEESSECDGT